MGKNCLNCGQSQSSVEYIEVFDELGKELELDKILEKHLGLLIKSEEFNTTGRIPAVCKDCMNSLIELIDIEERQIEIEQNHKRKDSGSKNHGTTNVFVHSEAVLSSEYISDQASNSMKNELCNVENAFVDYEQPHESLSVQLSESLQNDVSDDDQISITENEEVAEVEILQYEILSEEEITEDGCYSEEHLSEEIDITTDAEQIEYVEETESSEFYLHNKKELEFSDSVDIDLETYLDGAINSKLEDLDFQWQKECCFCSLRFESFQDVLKHIQLQHSIEPCFSAKDREAIFLNTKYLSRYIIFSHCDLQSLQIYSTCPDCKVNFSNFLHFNKHSCCRTLKRRAGVTNYCSNCKEEFSSYKRLTFHLQFHLKKCRPRACLICKTQFSDLNELFEHVQYSHESGDILACISCDRVFKTKSIYEEHIKRHKVNFKYECNYCTKKYHHKSLLDKHMESFHNDITEYECDLCSKTFQSDTTWHKHLRKHVPEADVQAYCCSGCGLIARDNHELTEHIHRADANSNCAQATVEEDILNVAYICEFCSMEFKRTDDLKRHRATGVHADGLYHCVLCQKQFNELKTLRNHTKTHGTYVAWLSSFPLIRLYMCDIEDCEKAYAQWVALYYHKRRFHKPKNPSEAKHKCQFCHMECPTKMSLSVHIARRHNSKNVTCPTCGSSYKDEKSLQEHIDYMHVPQQCNYCHKVISNRRNLVTHERVVHRNEQRYFCPQCDKGFYHKNEMEVHEKNVHTNVVYKCTECSFSTNYEKSLTIHMDTKHKQKFQYQCPICSKQFGRKHVLDLHVKRHEAHKQYVCSDRIVNGCDAAFISNYLLNAHIKQKHATLPSTKPSKYAKSVEATSNEPSMIVMELLESNCADDPSSVVIDGVDMVLEDVIEDENCIEL